MSEKEGSPRSLVDRDWLEWHRVYDDPASPFSWRLKVVQKEIERCLGAAPTGPIRAISLCAGQGLDILGALARHDRRSDVVARLVELDSRNVDVARQLAAESGLTNIDVVAGDASSSSAYSGAVPADVLIACGMLGNLRFPEVRDTIDHFLSLCAPDATIIWTYHRTAPDRTPTICAWFEEAGFEEVTFNVSPIGPEVVGAHRLCGHPAEFREGVRLFEFVGYDNLDYDLPPHAR